MENYTFLLRLLNGTKRDKSRLYTYLTDAIVQGKRLNLGHKLMLRQLKEEKINEILY